jgi:hypothetical protein
VIWRIGGANGCWYTREVYEMGDPVPATSLYFGMGGMCNPDTDGEREVRALGREIPFDTLPAATRVTIGSGRIRTTALESDGLRRAEYGFIDTEHGVPCTPTLARDGIERCLPNGGELEYFTTPNCTVPRQFAVRTLDSCEQTFPDLAHIMALDYTPPVVACGNGNSAVMSATAEVQPGTLYERNEASVCVPAMWNRDEWRVYELGAEILPREFAAFEHIVE